MAQRPLWRGHLRLALVSCPVALYSAKHDRNAIRFNLINPETGNRIRMVTQDAETGQELSRRDLVKGYEFKKNHYLLLSDEDLDGVKVDSSSVMGGREVRRGGFDRPALFRCQLLSGTGRQGRRGRLRRAARGDREDRPRRAVNLVYRDQLFPRTAFRRTWDALIAAQPPRNACRVMVGLLALAHDRACEAGLAAALDTILDDGDLPELSVLQQRFMPSTTSVPMVTVSLPAAVAYDALLHAPQEWVRS